MGTTATISLQTCQATYYYVGNANLTYPNPSDVYYVSGTYNLTSMDPNAVPLTLTINTYITSGQVNSHVTINNSNDNSNTEVPAYTGSVVYGGSYSFLVKTPNVIQLSSNPPMNCGTGGTGGGASGI